jgi:hypothetical protein
VENFQLGFTWIHLDCWGSHLDLSRIQLGLNLDSGEREAGWAWYSSPAWPAKRREG